MRPNPSRKLVAPAMVTFFLALGAFAFACGDDDDKSSDAASSTTRTQANGSSSSPGGGQGDPREPGDSPAGGSARRGGDAGAGTGGAGVPDLGRAPRRKSLERYLASKYVGTPWYPLLRRLRVTGGHVRVYLTFPPESDDEGPPQLACNAVLSYGREVRTVTVYGSPTPQGRTSILKRC